MKNTSTKIVGMVHSFQSTMRAILNYAEMFELSYGFPFAGFGINDIFDDTVPSR